MTDKVQKIRGYLVGMASAACCDAKTKKNIETNILQFIDSLQEEPVSDECIYNRTLEERQRSCKFCSAACQVRIKEEPVSEDLEKELSAYVNSKEYTNSIGTSGLLLIARHFANWQKQQDQETIELAEDHAMLAGMEKMKEQMMATGVVGVVHHFGKCKVASVHYNDPTGVPMVYFTSTEGLSAGDEVKIIVIKVD